MSKLYSEEFKKQLVKEYIKGKTFSYIEREYSVAKSTLSGWVKNITKNVNI